MPILKVETPRTPVYMVVDSESMFHRAYFAYTRDDNKLFTGSGRLSGGFFGFFSMLQRQIAQYSPNAIIFCWGDKRENLLRKQLYAEYKSTRDDIPKDGFREQLKDVQLTLYAMGFTQYNSSGYEGDDVIFSVVKKLVSERTAIEKNNYKIVILSTDKDMLQLVNDNIIVRSVASSSTDEFTPDKVIQKYGVPPSLLSDYFSLIGDTSDNVPGVNGIGPKTASKLLSDNGAIYTWWNNIEGIKASDATKQRLLASREQLIMSKKLISLKLYNAPLQKMKFTVDDIGPGIFFNKYDVTSISPGDFI